MADHPKSPLVRFAGSLADWLRDEFKRRDAAHEAQVADFRAAIQRVHEVLDSMRELAREQGREIQRLRKRCALLEDQAVRKVA